MSYGMQNSSSPGLRGPTGGPSASRMNAPSRSGEKIPKGYRRGQISNYNDTQHDIFQNSANRIGPGSYLDRLAGGDEEIFNEIEAPALKQFSGLQGGLASRFSQGGGQGSLGSRRSSGFQNTSNQFASDFASQLQSQRQSLRQNAINDLMEHSNQLLNQRPYQNILEKKQQKQGFDWKGLAGGVAGGVGGFFLGGGPMGAVKGGLTGYNMFSDKGGGGGSSPNLDFLGNSGGGGGGGSDPYGDFVVNNFGIGKI
jgi:hypothetical protein